MYLHNRKRVLALLLVLTGLALTLPSGVFAVQDMGGDESGRKTTVKQEFSYDKGEEPNIPQTISQFGEVLRLVSVSDPVESSSLPQSRTYTYRVSASYAADQLAQAPQDIKLTPVYGEGKRQVDRKETVRNLPDNDISRLVQRKSYADTSGCGPEPCVSGELALAEVRYDVSGWDEDGIPDDYTAHLVYRGEEAYTSLLYYTGEATYTKTVSAEGAKTFTVVATYEGEEPDEAADGTGGAISGGAGDGDGVSGGGLAVDGDNAKAPDMVGGETGVAENGGGEAAAVADGDTALRGGIFSRLSGALRGLSPVGAATLATIVAAVMTLLILGVYNGRKARVNV